MNCSGYLDKSFISLLREKHYEVIPKNLDGAAPKQFIKAYFYSQGKRNNRYFYIAKSAEKWAPVECVIECAINCIGRTLGLKMNDYKLVIANQTIRFLSKYFLKKGQILIHGAEIMGDYLGDRDMAKEIAEHRKNSRYLLDFQEVKNALNQVFPNEASDLQKELVKLLVFDALVGNHDRHFYNWGIISKVEKNQNRKCKFSPIYDSARGLLWNTPDEQLENYFDGNKIIQSKLKKYLENSSPRISLKNNPKANHYDLVEHFIKDKKFKPIVESLVMDKHLDKIIYMLKEKFFLYLHPKRSILIKEILRQRFKTIKGLLCLQS